LQEIPVFNGFKIWSSEALAFNSWSGVRARSLGAGKLAAELSV
jgi:hypothetical protein